MRRLIMLIAVVGLVALAIGPSIRTAQAAGGPPAFVQAQSFSSPSQTTTTQATLTKAVNQGDLLVGWFSEYDAPASMQVSDSVNGAWTRAPGGLAYTNDMGEIALFYRQDSGAAAAGNLTVTTSISGTSAYLYGTIAEYSGVSLAGALDQVQYGRAITAGTAVDSGPTAAVAAGELVYSAVAFGRTLTTAETITPGQSEGRTFTARNQAADNTTYEQDIVNGAAGTQDGTATLSTQDDWYAVVAVFRPYPATAPVKPGSPTGLTVTSDAATRVALAWTAPTTGDVAGYTVYRDGTAIGTTAAQDATFLDTGVSASTTHTYTVDAFDSLAEHSAPSAAVTATTPAVSPAFIQGDAQSTGTTVASYQSKLSAPVNAGDLLVGWFSQYQAANQVSVSDSVNGAWARVTGESFVSGTGDLGLYYVVSKAAPSGLTVSVAGSATAYIQFAYGDYRDGGRGWTLDRSMDASGYTGTAPSVGPTASIPAGELVVSSVLTGGQPFSATAGSSQNVPYAMDVQDGSASSDLASILSSAAGAQSGGFNLDVSSDWYMAIATFLPSTAPIAITSVSPSAGPFSGGQTVSISGAGFGTGDSVTFGGKPATGVTVVNANLITVTTPPGLGTVGVAVSSPGGGSATAAGGYTYNPAPDVSYFSWFDRISSPGFKADNIHVVNPTGSPANVLVNIPGQPGCQDFGTIPAGKELYFTCATGFGGPVTVNADQAVLASQRVDYYQTFNEVSAQSASQAQTQLYFSWFDRVSSPGFLSDNVHVIDPGGSAAAVTVKIPGCSDQTQTIAAGGEQIFTCAKGFGGPVVVNSNVPVLASQRVQYYQSFNEVNAQSATQAKTQLYFSWFDRVSSPGFLNDNVHVIDPGGSAATVTVKIPGCSGQTQTVAAGGEQIFTCAKGFGGPVVVSSNVPVLASQRVQYYQTFNEVDAQSAVQAQSKLYFAWFDRVSSPGFLNDNVHVIDPGGSAATVTVSIPGCSDQTKTVAAGGEQIFTCASGFGGPVVVSSNAGILASQRVQYYQSFNEVLALAP